MVEHPIHAVYNRKGCADARPAGDSGAAAGAGVCTGPAEMTAALGGIVDGSDIPLLSKKNAL